MDEAAFLQVNKRKVLRLLLVWTTILPDVASSANPLSLRVPVACEEDRQPTRERHECGAVYIERRGQRGGLEWKAPGAWFWLVIGQ
uniref:Secreted protein n=1 Tax=Mesocestoides corti TaxID=53468 RepID=A0A5K3EG41_MESCO